MGPKSFRGFQETALGPGCLKPDEANPGLANTVEWNFPKLEISIVFNLSNFFFLFSLFLLHCVMKRLLSKKYGVTGSVFKRAAI